MKVFEIVRTFTIFTLEIFRCTEGLSIQPPSEEIFSNQLCPDPTTKSVSTDTSGSTLSSRSHSQMPRKIMAINLDKPKDTTHFYESCLFKEQTGSRSKSKGSVRVRSINLNVNPWNFSTADNCSTFIKFNNWDERDGVNYPVLCGRENFDQYLGPYGHPMVLYYQWKNGGLSFPLFHSSYGPHHRDRKETLELNYMQIYFAILSENVWRCRVQQYRLDLLRLGCASVIEDEEPLCGEYNCPELETLYQAKMTIFKDGESENDTVLVWKTKTDKYRMRTFLRQKFVPVVFLIVLICAYRSYMKAGLRYRNSVQDDIPDFRIRSFRLRRHVPTTRSYPGRDVTDPFWDYDDDDHPPPYVHDHETQISRVQNDTTVVSIPTVTPQQQPQNSRVHHLLQPKLNGHVDPPPPYESVVCPPTYSEATTKP